MVEIPTNCAFVVVSGDFYVSISQIYPLAAPTWGAVSRGHPGALQGLLPRAQHPSWPFLDGNVRTVWLSVLNAQTFVVIPW